MKKMKKSILAAALTLALVVGGGTTAFAALDYTAWDSGGVYPKDVMGTKLLTPVKSLMDRKILTGDTDGLFHPDRGITRAEFATIMAKGTNNIGELAIRSNENTFYDMAGYEWAKGYINACAHANLIQGIGGGKFAPGRDVSYAEVMTIIIRAKGVTPVELTSQQWPDNYIRYAQMYNLTGLVQIYDWMAPAKRGDVAWLVYLNLPKDASAGSTVSLTTGAIGLSPAAGTSVTVTATTTGGSGSTTYAWDIDGIPQASLTNFLTFTAKGSTEIVTLKVTNSELGKNPVTTTTTLKLN